MLQPPPADNPRWRGNEQELVFVIENRNLLTDMNRQRKHRPSLGLGVCSSLLICCVFVFNGVGNWPVGVSNNRPVINSNSGSSIPVIEKLTAARSLSPANTNATAPAKAVLTYLAGLSNKSGKRVIAGQFGAFGEGTSVASAENSLEKIYELTGKWVAMTGMDYRNWDKQHSQNLSEPNQFLIEQWRKGVLVDVSWHAANPWSGGESTDCDGAPCGSAKAVAHSVRELIIPGTPAYANWMAMLDDVANGLTQLRDAGVVVIWRPLHEMNGGWFWWGLQQPADYEALWQQMFTYFTVTKGLNNLLWAYSPNVNNNHWNKSTTYFYPGDNYVDIVGLDKYMDIGENPLKLNDWQEYSDLLATKKPLGLFEFGPSPASSQPDRPIYDYAQLIRDIRNDYPQIAFFQAWEWHWAIGEHSHAAELLRDPWVITRENLPDWQTDSSLAIPAKMATSLTD